MFIIPTIDSIPNYNECTEDSEPLSTTANFSRGEHSWNQRVPFPTFQEEESPGSPGQWILHSFAVFPAKVMPIAPVSKYDQLLG